jgi:DNA-binding MarR family transcriptional regulator
MNLAARHEIFEDDDPAPLQTASFLPLRLAAAAEEVGGLLARTCMTPFGLTPGEWRVACHLAELGAAGAEELSRASGMEAAGVRLALERLEGQRRVEAVSPSGAWRLTVEGLRMHAETAPLALACEAALICGLTPAEVATLKRLLARLQGAAGALAGRGG